MLWNNLLTRCAVGAVLLAAVECTRIIAIEVALTSPAQAQFPFLSRQHPRSGGGFFGGLFGGGDGPSEGPVEQAPVEHPRAPPPRNPAPKADARTRTRSAGGLRDEPASGVARGL